MVQLFAISPRSPLLHFCRDVVSYQDLDYLKTPHFIISLSTPSRVESLANYKISYWSMNHKTPRLAFEDSKEVIDTPVSNVAPSASTFRDESWC
jgi:hypothetical protein